MQPELSRTDYSAFRECSQTETLHRREVGWALAVHTSRIARQPEIRRGMPSLQTGRGHMVFKRVGSKCPPYGERRYTYPFPCTGYQEPACCRLQLYSKSALQGSLKMGILHRREVGWALAAHASHIARLPENQPSSSPLPK